MTVRRACGLVSVHAAGVSSIRPTSTAKLSPPELERALGELDGWRHDGRALLKTLRFSSHPEAIAFLVRLAFVAEAQGHHAEIRNVYATVELTLTTHDAGDVVTEQDVRLARAIDGLSRVP